MREFVITTDSNADLPASFVEEHNITIIPQYYAFGETVYGDEKHLTPSQFYQEMRQGVLPTSMANNPAVIQKKFEGLLEKGYDILHIAFSSKLSGSCQNVMMAANELMEEHPDTRIVVVDSQNASLGEALLVLRAYDLKANGLSLDDIAAALESEKTKIRVEFTVDDLHHLQRGGRVSKTTAFVGSMINIKPLLYITETGELKSLGKARGRKKSMSALVDNMAEKIPTGFYQNRPVGILHGDCIVDAQYIAKLLGERIGCTNIIINDVSPSIGTHGGPGVLGLCYWTP